MLLILDNFEHLLPGAELVTHILKSGPKVKVLVTSRAVLNVQGERLFPVGGMNYPRVPPAASAGVGEYSALKLFVSSAQAARPDFEVTQESLADVVRICGLVDGLPLGIVLAAVWLKMLSPAEIVDEIERSIDFLEAEWRDVPERQRSMRAVLDHSWNLLTEGEKVVLAGLSVFRGGFTREAAHHVTGASLRDLRSLTDRCLVGPAHEGRYGMHELLRQYGEEKLDQSPGAGEAVRDRHAAHYAAALRSWSADLKGRRQRVALAEMDVDIHNARAAWDRAVAQRDVGLLSEAAEGLGRLTASFKTMLIRVT